MPLQIRRGTNAERQLLAVPLASGELLFTTDTNKLYIGDGNTLAKDLSPVANYGDEEAQDAIASLLTSGTTTDITFTYNDLANTLDTAVSISQLRQNISMGGFDVTGTGNIDITGSITADSITSESIAGNFSGSVFADDSTLLVDGVGALLNLDGTVRGNITPDVTETYDIGNPTKRFKDLYLSGSSLWLGDAQLTAIGPSIDLPFGSTINGQPLGEIAQPGNALQIDIIGEDSSIIVDTASNTVRGNFIGSVFADNSTVVLDGATGVLTGDLVGNVIGDVTGNVVGSLEGPVTGTTTGFHIGNVDGDLFGNVTGDVTGNVTGDVVGNIFRSDGVTLLLNNASGTLIGDVTGNVTGDVTGNLLGNVVGSLTGDITGSVFADDSTRLIDGTSGEFFVSEISSPTNTITIAPASGALRNELRLNALNNESAMKMLRSDSAVQPGNTRIASFKFDWEDDTNPNRTGALWGVNKDSIFFLINEAGTFTEESGFNYDIETGDGRFGINKFSPQATLHVNGDAIISGGLTADVTGSLFSDASTMLIDGTDGKLMAANVDVIGETGNTPVNDDPTTDAPTEWLELTVNGNTRYIPLYS